MTNELLGNTDVSGLYVAGSGTPSRVREWALV